MNIGRIIDSMPSENNPKYKKEKGVVILQEDQNSIGLLKVI